VVGRARFLALSVVFLSGCGGSASFAVRQTGPRSGRLMQSMDSASSACRQNPAYCTATAGEESILPVPVRVGPTFAPPQTSTSSAEHSPEASKDKTVELTPQETKKHCDEEFTRCLETPTQSKRGPLYKHSQCVGCRDLCVQAKGRWPAEANGMSCP
jgi:hypothetical protein